MKFQLQGVNEVTVTDLYVLTTRGDTVHSIIVTLRSYQTHEEEVLTTSHAAFTAIELIVQYESLHFRAMYRTSASMIVRSSQMLL